MNSDSSLSRLMTEDQAREIGLMIALTKLLVVAAFIFGGWQAYVTLMLNQHSTQIAEVKADATAMSLETAKREQDYRYWREEMTKIVTKQTTLIEGQQQQLVLLRNGH